MIRKLGAAKSGFIANCILFAVAPFSSANATTNIVSYDDIYYSGGGIVLSNTTGLLYNSGGNHPERELSLSRFDPSLGTLQSVELSAQLFVQGGLTAHCNSAAYCWANATGRVGDSLSFDQASFELGIDLGAAPLSISFNMSVACEDTGIFATCQDGVVRSLFQTEDFSFTGSDVAPFIGTDPFTIQSAGFLSHGVSVFETHEGFPSDSTFAALADDGGDGFALAYLIDSIRKGTSTDAMHTGLYNHAHVEGYSMKAVRVQYTYESLPAVPEPSVWMMLTVGFGLTGGALRRTARRQVLA